MVDEIRTDARPEPDPTAGALIGALLALGAACESVRTRDQVIEGQAKQIAYEHQERVRAEYAAGQAKTKLEQIMAVANAATSAKGLNLHETLDAIISIGERPFVVESCAECGGPIEDGAPKCSLCDERIAPRATDAASNPVTMSDMNRRE